ncbi:MAG TPA: hypothetical protein VFC07_14740, partial [Verrucomicrobiae bacterium]|nr:hypothetical protein [Verrucomicrobiae bacterium]
AKSSFTKLKFAARKTIANTGISMNAYDQNEKRLSATYLERLSRHLKAMSDLLFSNHARNLTNAAAKCALSRHGQRIPPPCPIGPSSP